MIDILSSWRTPREISWRSAKVLAASDDWAAGFQIQISGGISCVQGMPGLSAPTTTAAVSPALFMGSGGRDSLQATGPCKKAGLGCADVA